MSAWRVSDASRPAPKLVVDHSPDPVHRQHGRLTERGRIERGRRVGEMVLGEQEPSPPRLAFHVCRHRLELLLQEPLQEELFLEPDRHGCHERPPALRGEGEIGLQQALELEQRLVVEDHVIQVAQPELSFLQTVGHGMGRESGVVLFAGEAFFLRRRHDRPVDDERGRRVVVEGGNAQNLHIKTAYR